MTPLDARMTVDDKFYTFCPHNLRISIAIGE